MTQSDFRKSPPFEGDCEENHELQVSYALDSADVAPELKENENF